MLVCLKCTNAYGKVNVWDLYDTNGLKIGLLQRVYRTQAIMQNLWNYIVYEYSFRDNAILLMYAIQISATECTYSPVTPTTPSTQI